MAQKKRGEREANGRPRGFAALRAGGAHHGVGDATLRRRAPRRSCGGRVVGGLRSRCCGHGCGEDRALTAIGVAGRLRRQWLRWLTEHGEAYEYDVSI